MRLPTAKGTKKQEITMYFLFLECWEIFLKIQEKSSTKVMNIKIGPVPGGSENKF